jgi:hypothetical protein
VDIAAPVGRISKKRAYFPPGFQYLIDSASGIAPSAVRRLRRLGIASSRLIASYYEWDYRISYTPHTYWKHLHKLKRMGIKNVIQQDMSCWYGEPWEKRINNVRLNFLFAHIAQVEGFNVLPNFNTFWSESLLEHVFPKRVPSICIDGAHSDHAVFLHEEKLMLTHLCRRFGVRSVVVITGKSRIGPLRAYVDVMAAFGGSVYFVPSEAKFLSAGSKAAKAHCKDLNEVNQ